MWEGLIESREGVGMWRSGHFYSFSQELVGKIDWTLCSGNMLFWMSSHSSSWGQPGPSDMPLPWFSLDCFLPPRYPLLSPSARSHQPTQICHSQTHSHTLKAVPMKMITLYQKSTSCYGLMFMCSSIMVFGKSAVC